MLIPNSSEQSTAEPATPSPSSSSTLHSTSSVASPGRTTPPRDDIIATVIEDAVSDSTFLGHAAFRDRCDWRADLDGREVLVEKTTGQPVQAWVVGEISTRQFWLQPCGMWSASMGSFRDSNSKTSGFESHVASAYVAEPFTDNAGLKNLHSASVKNLRELVRLKPGGTGGGHIVDGDGRIKIRHKIFEQIDPSEYDDDEEDKNKAEGEGEDKTIKWSMANWPCKSTDAERARNELARTKTYIPRLLAAYNVNGRLIDPPDYEAKLKGALAKVVITISRWCIRNQHTLCADIIEMHLLRKPIALLSTPRTPQKKKKAVQPPAPTHSPRKVVRH